MNARKAWTTGESGLSTPRIGRPPVVDREAVIEAALALGLSQLTMTAVGNRLGISHSTIYRYFPGRDALAAAAVDHAVHSVEWPERGDDWRAYLVATAWAHWRLFTTHPGLAEEITALRVTGAALVRRSDQTAVDLLHLGFEPTDAVLVMDMLAELVTQAFLAARPEDAEGSTADAMRQRRRALLEPWLDDYDPRIREVMIAAVTGAPTEWFERKLNLFLDGVAARRKGEPNPG